MQFGKVYNRVAKLKNIRKGRIKNLEDAARDEQNTKETLPYGEKERDQNR